MKLLKRVIAVLLILVLNFSNSGSVNAATIKDYCIMEHEGFTFTMDYKTITPKYYWTRGLWNENEYNPEIAIYYQVKEIAKILKGTKKEFSIKYNSKSNSLTFYPNKNIVSADVDVKLNYTTSENSKNKSWGEDLAFDRSLKVYSNKTATKAKVLIYKGTFYMKLEDIAKVANFGISRTKDLLRYNINSQSDYKSVEVWKPDFSIYKIDVDIKPSDKQSYDELGIIKPLYPDAEFIESPRTKEDFDKLIQYMLENYITTCNIKTNIPYEDMQMYNILADVASKSDYLARPDQLYESPFFVCTYDIKKNGNYGTLELKSKGYYYESEKQLAKKAKAFNEKVVKALQGMISNGELTAEMTETEKAKAIFTWISKHVEYDWDTYLNHKEDSYTAYDALIDKTAVCSGYTALYNIMCRYVGLNQTETITGQADGFLGKGGHAWTAQVLDGKKVMTDSTWGDVDGDAEEGTEGYADYSWFARPVSYFKKNNHYWNTDNYSYWK